MPKMAKNGCTWLGQAGNGWKWLNMAQKKQELPRVDRNGWKWLELAGNFFQMGPAQLGLQVRFYKIFLKEIRH